MYVFHQVRRDRVRLAALAHQVERLGLDHRHIRTAVRGVREQHEQARLLAAPECRLRCVQQLKMRLSRDGEPSAEAGYGGENAAAM